MHFYKWSVIFTIFFGYHFCSFAKTPSLANEPNRKIAYQREFFKHWIDEDKNCLNTRQEILKARSLEPVKMRTSKKGPCSVAQGKWNDFYFNEILTDSEQVDIDHVVPLKHAWDTGASLWSDSLRENFANDPENLVITHRKYNRTKGAKTFLEWMPIQKEYACKYAAQWFKVKQKYQLSISDTEVNYKNMLKCL